VHEHDRDRRSLGVGRLQIGAGRLEASGNNSSPRAPTRFLDLDTLEYSSSGSTMRRSNRRGRFW